VVLYFIDLDGFKRLNDTLGHPTGDAVLRMLADRLRRCARGDDIVARLGGDEFALLHPVLPTSKTPTALANELVHSISRPYDVGGSQLPSPRAWASAWRGRAARRRTRC
jgi:diguanylate cyclase (GGDEF)-like protein